jgi:hypothetical protein
MRDPVIDNDVYFKEAVAALDCLLPTGAPLRRLVFTVIYMLFGDFVGKTIRQSDLDDLRTVFAQAVDEAEG